MDSSTIKTSDRPLSLPAEEGARAFLMAEYQHLCESFLSNEQLGEGRVNFFLALVGGVLAAFGLSENVGNKEVLPFTMATLLFLLLFGWLTLNRLIHRNIVTDKYKIQLSTIRGIFAEAYPGLLACLPFNPTDIPELRQVKWNIFHISQKAGLVEVVCFVNACIAGTAVAVLLLAAPSFGSKLSFSLSAVAAVVVWLIQVNFVFKRYRKEISDKLTKALQASS